MKSSARTHGERRPPGRPGQAGWEADGGGERGRTTRGAGAPGAEHALERPQGRALREADGGGGGRVEDQGRRGGGGTRQGGHARKGSPGCLGGSPAAEGAGPGNLRAWSMRSRARACHAPLLRPALRPQRPSFFLRAPGVAAAEVPPGAWQGGRCWVQWISARRTRAARPVWCALRSLRVREAAPPVLSWRGRGDHSGSGSSRPRSVHTTLVEL